MIGVSIYLAGWLIFLFTIPRTASKSAENEIGESKKDTLCLAKFFIVTSPVYPIWLIVIGCIYCGYKMSEVDFAKFWAIFGVKDDQKIG